MTGLSPRVRGNLVKQRHQAGQGGSIPACAGEPFYTCCPSLESQVYPRVCGGTHPCQYPASCSQGLSPRVRGNLLVIHVAPANGRSIPACAGEPRPLRSIGQRTGVYPRVCGGTINAATLPGNLLGLSPRVRGNHVGSTSYGHYYRSIPACAGEPTLPPSIFCSRGVYPRVCGGTYQLRAARFDGAGLSPRVRGNPIRIRGGRSCSGSIPACAGEPDRWDSRDGGQRVYPRVCGGTDPETRGLHSIAGSIPACAGEPL